MTIGGRDPVLLSATAERDTCRRPSSQNLEIKGRRR